MNEPDATVAADEWAELCEPLMRGVVHALNNHIMAMSAHVQLAAMGDEGLPLQQVLPARLSQLEQTTAHLRALSVEKRPAEAIEIMPVIQEAIALHAYHLSLRGIRCDVQPTSELVPLRVPRWALSRLLLVLIDRAKHASQRAGRNSFVLRIEGDDRYLVLRTLADEETDPYAQSLAALCGATIARTNGENLLRLPSLIEVRRLDRQRAPDATSGG